MSNVKSLSATALILILFSAAAAATRADASDRDELSKQKKIAQDALYQLNAQNSQLADLKTKLAGDEDKLAHMPDLGEPLTDEQMSQIQDFIDSLHSTDPADIPLDVPVIDTSALPAPGDGTAAQ